MYRANKLQADRPRQIHRSRRPAWHVLVDSEQACIEEKLMTVPLNVLIVEDSADDAELLLRELRRGDYDAQFERVDSSTAMSAALDRKAWDVVICDYSLPHFSGVDALRLLRARSSEIPFIFLSGTIGEDAAVAALKEGPQDYIMKGNLMRLLPAIQRELHEAEARKERSRMEWQLQQLQKFEAIGRLAGSIAHVPSLRSLHRTATVRAASQSY
ncbi:MAG TPA: response regulator [Terracidiphilus sp.]|nr:response regulator [Terracidiphilus sp.]